MSAGPMPNGEAIAPDVAAAIRQRTRAFLDAVEEGDGEAVWELLSEDARAYVLNLAIERGMDFDLGSRLRQGTAGEQERAEYLEDLVAGLRHDLRGVELDRLELELGREAEARSRIRVTYLVGVGKHEGGGPAHLIPAGSLTIVEERGGWRVDRLRPRPG